MNLPPLPTNLAHVTRRIRACESEVPAQVVLEHCIRQAQRDAVAAAVPGWMPIEIERLRGELRKIRDCETLEEARDIARLARTQQNTGVER